MKTFRKLVILTTQATIVIAAFNIAILLRHDGSYPAAYISSMVTIIVPLVLIKLFIFNIMHLHSGWWRYVSIHDLVLLVKANIMGSLLFVFYLHYTPANTSYNISTSLIILDGLLCFLIMSGSRVAVRLGREYFTATHKEVYGNGTEKVLIVGAGAAGQSLAREITQNPHLKWKVVGFVDKDANRAKKWFQGIPVLATIDDLKKILPIKSISHVLLADPSLCQKELRRIVKLCNENSVKSKILPNVESILNGDVSIHHVRDVKLEDLLGRPPITLETSRIEKYLHGKTVLVTGAAGSIGSEICRQVSQYGVKNVILFDSAETPLFNIERELFAKFPNIRFITQLSDVRDNWQVEHVFKMYHPEVVFHAAAYKHVPMSEKNPLTVIDNNVLGTRILAYTASRYQVQNFVMISTDKAVNPTNVMGASKRAAEVYVQALAKTSQTKMVTVRFGNVLGSNGSVVPIFQEQISKGGPVTVTHPEVTRYFMTIPEAVQLVLQSGSMGEGGEIFVLDMGEQIKITQLAEELIRLSGMVPYEDIDIVFTGLRPGEKLHEELLHEKEGILPTNHEKIQVALARQYNYAALEKMLDDLSIACCSVNMNQALFILTNLVPEFISETGSQAVKSVVFMPRKSKIFKFPSEAVV